MPDPTATFTTSYDRPVDATLLVRLADGNEWPATDDDLRKFGLVRAQTVLQRVSGNTKCGDPDNCTCRHGCDIP